MKTMIKAKLVLFAALCTVIMLVSCDLLFIFKFNEDNDLNQPLKDDEFYAQHMETGKYYKVKADIAYEGKRCIIWAERGSGISRNQAKSFADEYDTIIRTRIVNTFSNKNFSYKYEGVNYYFDDMLEFANWLVDKDDNKLTILLLDIQDGFKNPETDPYVAGYFFSGNFWSRGKIEGTSHYSNGRDMIYVDTYPGLTEEPSQTYATFAHELQHLINFVTTRAWLDKTAMDTWVDEGLSSQAEYIYLEKNLEFRCEWFSEDPAGTIAKGNNFFVWDNHKENSRAILDDYATVYLFFRWLYLQANAGLQSHIFNDIITSGLLDYRAVTNVAKNIRTEWSGWDVLLRTWFAANYNPTDSIYGYKGDSYLQTGDGKNFNGIKINPIAGTSISLYPGEGVYSLIKDSFSATNGSYIRYAGLSANNSAIHIGSPYRQDILLTFNANTRNTAGSERGQLTGVSPLVSTARSAAQPEKITGRYVMDARDFLERARKE